MEFILQSRLSSRFQILNNFIEQGKEEKESSDNYQKAQNPKYD